MKLSKTHQEILQRFGEEETIAHSRWVKPGHAGGDPYPRAYIFLKDKRLIRATDVDKQPNGKQTKLTTVTTYKITQKGKDFLRNLTHKQER